MPKPAFPPDAAASASPGAAPPPVRRGRPLETVEALFPHLFVPTRERPVRAKQHHLSARTRVIPHTHSWAQISVSLDGVLHLAAPQGTLIAPPSKAVWIPPGLVHAVAMVEDAVLTSIYVLQDDTAQGPVLPGRGGADACDPHKWARCRVLDISPLMRELIIALPKQRDDQPLPDAATLQREHHLGALLLEELRHAREVNLGVDMPRDKRLRMLCEAVVADPTQHGSLAAWAADTGASPRTVARLFQQELGCSFTAWRQQVVLAHAVSLAARGLPIQQIAAELGYGPSAFSAMVHRTVGMPPARFFGQQAGAAAARAAPGAVFRATLPQQERIGASR
ncbi:HTH-type transcriptional repressor of iron proteins A [Delftia tsuruhatensis]|uniref:AraC family transcriptional regulator n=1 Tax=Delftia tsuruhatensis TaxID=180282 RepID=UPI001E78A909|nr:helix-turn-helix transcriptional regulator [Delftia tsuruhatensis]CAB5680246.1 HTH-type transcriptional repressor of iron proteins A [Delftia tsuruhatensis]CAC9675540.1 HTH-type transcriptional repressor of iron proteins A [Delftia tsuruhatensis]